MENLNEDYIIDMELERRIIGRLFFNNDGNWIPMLSENRKYFKGDEEQYEMYFKSCWKL